MPPTSAFQKFQLFAHGVVQAKQNQRADYVATRAGYGLHSGFKESVCRRPGHCKRDAKWSFL